MSLSPAKLIPVPFFCLIHQHLSGAERRLIRHAPSPCAPRSALIRGAGFFPVLEAISCLSSCLRNGCPAPLPGSRLALIFLDIIIFVRRFCRERTFIIKKSFVFEICVFYVILFEFIFLFYLFLNGVMRKALFYSGSCYLSGVPAHSSSGAHLQ